jgi:hypothetical protein
LGATTTGELCPAPAPDLGTTFDGEASYGAALIGYQFRTQALFLKLFAGVEAEDQSITPRDPENSVQGSAVGLKLAAESWLDLSPLWFLSVDASYGTAFQQYWSLARAGYRLSPRFSLGLEGGALGNEEYDAGRGGRFVKANLRQPGAHALRRLHRKLSRRRTERLCVARRLSRLLRRTGCTAGPAPAVLSSSAWRSPKADRIYGQAGDAPTLVVHSVPESLPECPSENLSEQEG